MTAAVADVFGAALAGAPCRVVASSGTRVPLPVDAWLADADDGDRAIVRLCLGPTLDVGCGPGRMTAALARAGHIALGIDVVPSAVELTVARGAMALRRSVHQRVPGEGRWRTALLADGNIGIGGDPVRLLRRLIEIVVPNGRIVAEVAGPGVRSTTHRVALECRGARSEEFSWAVVGVDDIAAVAATAGLRVDARRTSTGRWAAVLEVGA